MKYEIFIFENLIIDIFKLLFINKVKFNSIKKKLIIIVFI